MVGGEKQLTKLLGITSYREYLNLFNDLRPTPSQIRNNAEIYKNNKDTNVFILWGNARTKDEDVYCNSDFFINTIEDIPITTRNRIIRDWLDEVYDIIPYKIIMFQPNSGGTYEYITHLT